MPQVFPGQAKVAVDHKDNVAKVARLLKGKGFVLNETLEAIGVLTGSAPATAVPAVRRHWRFGG